MEERLERASRSCAKPRKDKNGEKRVPQRGLGVAQLEKLRMEEQKKAQQHGLGLIPCDHLHRQMKAAFQPSHPSPTAAPFALDLSPRDSIMCLAGLNVNVPIRRTNNNLVLAESNSCVTHASVAPDSMVVASTAPFQKGLGSEIYGSSVVNHHELRIFEPSQWPLGHLTELPMMSVSSCGAVQTEPPSNQIYSANAANWAEEDKIPGRKRLWPFSPEIAIESKSTRLELPNLDPVGIFRNSAATCFEPIQMTAEWHANSETVLSACKYPSEMKYSCDCVRGQRQKLCCLRQAIVRDSCSSGSTSLMQPGFQLNWKGSCENDISYQEKEMACDFLTLGLSTSVNGSLHSKHKEHSVTSDGKHPSTSDTCEEHRLPNNLQQERSLEPGNPTMYLSGGLLKHRSTSTIDDRCSTPIYKLLCHPSNTKGLEESVCEDNINKPGDLDLRLSL